MRATLAFFNKIKARWTSRRAIGAERIAALSSTVKAAVLKRRQLARMWGAAQPDDVVRVAGAGVLVGIGYYVGAQVGFALTFPGSLLSIIWPPNTILLTALLLAPPRRRWVLALVLGVLPAHLLMAFPSGMQWWTALGLYLTNCTEALLGAWGVRRFSGGPPWLGTLRAVVVYIGCAVIAAPFVTSFLDAGVIVASHWGPNQDYRLLWEERFVSNMLTYLTLPPVLLLGVTSGRAWLRSSSLQRQVEATVLAVSMAVACSLVFIYGARIAGSTNLPAVVYALLPVLLWAAVRFGVGGTSSALLGATLMASIYYVRGGSGPFATGAPATDVLALQHFLIAIAVPLLLLAALVQERERGGMALRESEERFRTMADLVPINIWLTDAEDRVTFFNRQSLTFGGLTPDEVNHGAWREIVNVDEQERRQEETVAARAESRPYSTEYRVRRADGAWRWIFEQTMPRFAADGAYLGSIGCGIDITERKEAEEALRASEERYRDLVETQTELICRYLPDTTLTFVNDAYCRYFGKSRQELIGTKFTSLLPATAAARSRAKLKRFMAAPHVVSDEHEVILPNGHLGWQQWVAHAIVDAEGKVIEIQAIGRDLTERKQAEEALRQSEERFRAFFELTAVGAVEADPTTGQFLRVNVAFCQITGYSEEELLRLGFRDLTHLDDREQDFLVFRRYVLAAIPSWGYEKRFVHKDGQTIWVQVDVSLVHDAAGRPVHAVAIVQDITERKRTHEALEHLSAQLLRAQDEERRRISRNLHEGTAQTVVGLTLNLANLRGLLGDSPLERDRAEHLLIDSQTLAEEALREMRMLSYLLHPPQLDDAGLVPTLEWYVQRIRQQSSIHIDFVAALDHERMPTEVETALFRVVQECLANVQHAGSSSALIVLRRRRQVVHLLIEDCGTGQRDDMLVDVAPAEVGQEADAADAMRPLGVGIAGMRQRLHQLGGRLKIGPSKQGTRVLAVVPLPEQVTIPHADTIASLGVVQRDHETLGRGRQREQRSQ